MPIVSYNRGGMFKKKTSQFKTLSRDLVSCDLSFDILDKIIYVFTNNNIDFSSYQSGARVYHKKFGEGTINYVEPEGEDLKVDINFDKVGHKRLMAKYANLEIL